ncbi:GNAT family N-acetyltransferase [Levilactobacillus bambusae]|uniref:GNAT family N-acetyltransferase n=1 Tax=Levilactobacillus bambusae TaxID=2024736 RepID=A0A2V1MZ21_9LACO|nr:GNAT family N-acetyltransferase [Levilactobacillus bambusae]PWG00207.1 GNAT family N-acetyltransferase [Levilactobacillus bambusae]
MASIYCRLATSDDLPTQMAIINEAKALLKRDGSPQWQDGHPDRQQLERDQQAGISYVLVVDGHVAGTAALMQQPDPNYENIEGRWHSDGPYAVIHRIAISGEFHGLHLADFFFALLVSEAVRLGFKTVRIDTHEMNRRMQHIILKAGFTYCGIVQMNHHPDDLRLAYDLIGLGCGKPR